MNKYINNYLKSHKKANYFQRCFRRRNDDVFVNEVLAIGKDPLRIHIQRLGEKNEGRLVYIAQTMGCDGFFAELRFLLHEIFFAEQFGMTPVAFIPQTSCYCEDHPVNGSSNPFEYYFEQISDISLEDAFQSTAVVEHNFYQRDYIKTVYDMKSGYIPTEGYMLKMAELVEKYLHLNNATSKMIFNDIDNLLHGKKTLAVHVRGADFKRHYLNHPNMVTVDEYIEHVRGVLQTEVFEQVFLATDDIEAVERFKEELGEAVVCFDDVIRTSGDDTVMRSTSSRDLNRYKLGLEVIRDMYALSSCNAIVAGLSNVSIFARIVKLSRGEDYSVMKYINKGIREGSFS